MYELTKALKHFLNGAFIGVNHNTLLTQHQDVHGQPFGGHPQWVVYIGKEREGLFSVKKSKCFANIREDMF